MFFAILLILLSLYIFYTYKKQKLTYWQTKGFPTLVSTNFFFGDVGPALLGQKSFIEVYQNAHNEFKRRGCKIGGVYLMNLPMLLVTDNELAKKMLSTDFEAFADRGIATDPINNPLSVHIFTLDGDAWVKIRRKLSPTFTTHKVKSMMPILEKKIDVLVKVLEKERYCQYHNGDVHIAEWLDKVGVDVIGEVAFGLDCNTLEGYNQTFFEMTRRILNPSKLKIIKLLLTGLNNPAQIVALLSSDAEMSKYFMDLIKNTVNHRLSHDIKTNDFLQSLIDLLQDEQKEPGTGLKMAEIPAQAFFFFVAGSESSARTVTFALYTLAKRTDIQEKLRAEILKDLKNNNGEFTYEWLMNNEYLDMVLKETLRLYTPVMTLNRMSTRDYDLDDGLTIPKGTCIVFSSFGFHRDPEYFEKPLEFIPERFSCKNSENLKPYTNLPFGEGTRGCISKKFAYLLTKLELAKIISKFNVIPSEKTKYPLEISPLTGNMLLAPKDPLYFRFKPI